MWVARAKSCLARSNIISRECRPPTFRTGRQRNAALCSNHISLVVLQSTGVVVQPRPWSSGAHGQAPAHEQTEGPEQEGKVPAVHEAETVVDARTSSCDSEAADSAATAQAQTSSHQDWSSCATAQTWSMGRTQRVLVLFLLNSRSRRSTKPRSPRSGSLDNVEELNRLNMSGAMRNRFDHLQSACTSLARSCLELQPKALAGAGDLNDDSAPAPPECTEVAAPEDKSRLPKPRHRLRQATGCQEETAAYSCHH